MATTIIQIYFTLYSISSNDGQDRFDEKTTVSYYAPSENYALNPPPTEKPHHPLPPICMVFLFPHPRARERAASSTGQMNQINPKPPTNETSSCLIRNWLLERT